MRLHEIPESLRLEFSIQPLRVSDLASLNGLGNLFCCLLVCCMVFFFNSSDEAIFLIRKIWKTYHTE